MRLFLFIITVAFSFVSISAPRYGAIVLEATSGRSLYEKNSDVQTQPASLTKMMTLLLTFREIEAGRLSWHRRLRVSPWARQQAPSILGLRPGQTLSVRQAVLALITKSANDVAVVLAENIAGSETAFVARMNKEARRLGMISTHFCNASGLPHAQQISTARDMARLSRVLIYQYSKYYPLFSTKSFMYAGQTYPNHNALLGRTRNGVVIDGLKTGFVSASGFNLAASAVKGDRRLIVVVLGGPDRLWRDARVAYLFRYGFDGQFPGKPSLPRTRDIPQETVLQVFEKDDEIAHLIQSLDLSQPPRPARTKKPATRPKTRKLSKQHIVCVPVTQERPEVFLAHLKRRLPKKLLAQTSSQIKTSKRAKGSTVAFLCDNRKQALALHKALHKRGFQSIHQT